MLENYANPNYYEPASTKRNDPVFTGNTESLTLKYKNSYFSENTIIIRITHKVRSGYNLDDGKGDKLVRGEWGKVTQVRSLTAPFTNNSGNFSKYYGLFFVPKDNEY
jgi:hypothetical protein